MPGELGREDASSEQEKHLFTQQEIGGPRRGVLCLLPNSEEPSTLLEQSDFRKKKQQGPYLSALPALHSLHMCLLQSKLHLIHTPKPCSPIGFYAKIGAIRRPPMGP